ncbi:tyrosine-type recombinase/integrase [archaeon]|nr:tyrosine-type recombinase/integrase [archaeon]
MGIHNYERRYNNAIKRFKKANITSRNRNFIFRMCDDFIIDGLSQARLLKYIDVMLSYAKTINVDFDKLTKDDLKLYVSELQKSNYSTWTKHTNKIIIRKFFKWLYQCEGKEYPEIVKFITIRMKRSDMNLPSEGDLLTEKEVKKIIDTAEHPRNKAIISCLWEAGARISEIGNLKIKNVCFDKFGVVISVKGKTGSRKIRLISSTQYLLAWISIHPLKEDLNSPLWVVIGGPMKDRNNIKKINYGGLSRIIKLTSKNAGIKKRCNPHTFRHSRATFMANHLTEFQMNQYFGWIQGSNMPSTYVHMSGKSVDDAIYAMNGMKEVERQETVAKPSFCPRCEAVNANDNKFCYKCGASLNLKSMMEIEQRQKDYFNQRKKKDQLMDLFLEDHRVQALLAEKMLEFRNQGIGF